MPIRQAVILVGGLGTRLGPLTRATPKPLLEVGGRPFVAWLIDELRRHGISKILLLAGFEGQQVRDAVAGQDDVTVHVEAEPLGTGGALRDAADLLDDRFFMLNGDSLFDVNLWDLAQLAEGAAAAMALRPVEDASRYGAATLRDDQIVGFESGGASGPGDINGGVLVLSREILGLIGPGKVSLESEVIPQLAASGQLRGRVYHRPFLDIGVPDDFERSQTWIHHTLRRGAVIFDRDGVLNRDVAYAHRPDQIEWMPGAVEAVKAVNDAGLFAFVATNQAGVARGLYSEQQVQDLHLWFNAEMNRHGAHIDAFEYSPFHPDGVVEAYARVSDCRKPGPLMLRRLIDGHAVDPARTVMIGDQITDVQAAEAAGIEGVLFDGSDLKVAIGPIVSHLTG